MRWLKGWDSEHNVESFSSSGSVMLQLSIGFYFNDLRGAEKGHTRLKSRHHSRNVLQSHIYGWPDSFVNCLTSWANQKDLESRSCGSRNWKKKSQSQQGNHSNPHFGNATAWLHATLMLPFSCVETSTKAFAALWAWLQSTNCDLRCYPWVSNALIEVSEVLLWAVKISALPFLDPPQLSNIMYN